MYVSDSAFQMIREHEMLAQGVWVNPINGDVFFKLPEHSGLSVPPIMWMEYCRRMGRIPNTFME
jgi:hypothetical protein